MLCTINDSSKGEHRGSGGGYSQTKSFKGKTSAKNYINSESYAG